MSITLSDLQYAVDAAMGRRPGTLLLKNVRLVNVFSLTVQPTHILLAGPLVAAVGPEYAGAEALEVLDLEGRVVAPGLIDGHVHLESSLVSPAEYARGVVPRGVTGVVTDPHEIGNVAGVAGIEWLMEASEGLPLEVWITVPSSVPSTPLETSGATLGQTEIEHLLAHPRVVGVAELMSFPAILAADAHELSKVLLAERFRKSPEGHAPTLTGRPLQGYLATGIASDHESTTLEEGRAKLEAGCFLMVREGSTTRNLEALAPLLKPQYADRIGLVTDDRLPSDLLREGGVDFLVRKAIALGAGPAYAIRAGSWNVARHYRLMRRGAVAPGFQADLVVLDDLQTFQAAQVYQRGRLVAEQGRLRVELPKTRVSAAVSGTVKLPALRPQDLRIPAFPGKARVVRAIPHQVLTAEEHTEPTVRNGEVVADPARDLAKLVCLERYGKNGQIGKSLVTAFGLQKGALACTVGHDHHNLMAVGVSDDDIVTAAQRLQALGGGMIAVADGEVLAELALPIAGLITDEPLEQVNAKLQALEAAARQLGVTLPDPYMVLSFLGLAVIPELRLTDYGLVDVHKGTLVPLAVES
ncbi:adenine deaminase [Meiothermus sp.]|uniref:adenine deaminase n=1 Tax=Meiothermus sp. TaxID=1955249 RepID=UPI0021DC6177|nr:adenine deaminase [Meiothermus sp.]GIW35832.1 MAG: adenine deaminase [Meiothermus sp.]GIW37034.1 MAG: adenine deaminase [Meiothermus sp.]